MLVLLVIVVVRLVFELALLMTMLQFISLVNPAHAVVVDAIAHLVDAYAVDAYVRVAHAHTGTRVVHSRCVRSFLTCVLVMSEVVLLLVLLVTLVCVMLRLVLMSVFLLCQLSYYSCLWRCPCSRGDGYCGATVAAADAAG